MSSSASPVERGDDAPRRSVLRGILAPRFRTWVLIVPIHLVAFTLFYFATDLLLQRELGSIASAMASGWLSHEADEIGLVARVATQDGEPGHDFSALTEIHGDIGFRLFLPGGAVIGADQALSRTEHDEMVEFLRTGEASRFWLSPEDGPAMRGLQQVVARDQCVPCHQQGEVLAVASMSLDLTSAIERVSARSRRNLLGLIAAWAVAMAGTSIIVGRSARRSAARLDAALASVEGASKVAPGTTKLVLDPVSAELHESVRRFLARQREREAELASRLAHTDRLASLGQLAAGLAHEIKNPLAGIQGALEILRQDLPQQADRDLCSDMLGELDRVNEILRSLLTSARPSPPQRRATDLRGLAEEVGRLVEPGLRRRDIAFEIESATGALEAQVDPAKIRQVLVNLISNGADAAGSGGRILLRVGRTPEGDGIIFAVRDNGPGISEEIAGKVLDPFFTTKFTGTGLGLPIANSLVEQHGGSLHFESEPGEGTTFYVLLPSDLDDGGQASETETRAEP